MRPGVSESLGVTPGCGSAPISDGTSTIISRARECGSAKMSAMLMTGECGMSCACSSSIVLSNERAANQRRAISRTTSTCFGRSVALAKRGSLGSSGSPSMTHRRWKRCWAGAVTADVPRAAEGRADGGVAGPLAQRARLAERGDARQDQARVERAQRLPAEAPLFQHARAKVLEHDVDPRNEAPHVLLSLRRAEIQRHQLLVPVVDSEPVGDAVLARAEAAEVVALARHLRLDDLGAELGHERAAERARDHLGQLQHPD